MKSEFLIKDLTTGQLNALVKVIMQQTGAATPEEAVLLVNSGDYILTLPPLMPENTGIITLSVVSDGTTPPAWHERLKKKFQIGYNAGLILSDERVKNETFTPTNGVTTNIAILHGKLFPKKERTLGKIREFAQQRNMVAPHAEVSCLLREKLTNDEIKGMGLRTIIVMHEPLPAPYVFMSKTYTNLYLLDISTDNVEHGGYLSEFKADEGNPLPDNWGFAFAIQD